MQIRKNLEMKQIKKQEEIDKILSRSRSVSLYDLFRIRNVNRILICCLSMALTDYNAKLIYKTLFGQPKDSMAYLKNVTNPNFLIGLNMVALSMIGTSKFF